MSREAMKMSLNAYDQTELELCEVCGWKAVIPDDGCLVCARQQIKPVAYVDNRIHGWPDCFVMEPDPPHTTPLYAAPREWQGLTEDEVDDIWNKYCDEMGEASINDAEDIARAIEAKLKEKNT